MNIKQNHLDTLDISDSQAISHLHKRTYSSSNEVFDVIWADNQGNLLWHQEVDTTSSDYGHVSYSSNQLSQAKQDLKNNHKNTSHIIESHTHPDMSSSLSQQDISTITNNTNKHSHLLRIEAKIWSVKWTILRLFDPDGSRVKAKEIKHHDKIANSKDTFLFVDENNHSKIIRKNEISHCLSPDMEKQVA